MANLPRNIETVIGRPGVKPGGGVSFKFTFAGQKINPSKIRGLK